MSTGSKRPEAALREPPQRAYEGLAGAASQAGATSQAQLRAAG